MRSTMWFTTLRLLLFVAVGAVLWLAGARGILLLGLAALVSAVISFLALQSQRAAMANDVASRFASFRRRLDAGTRAEDDD